MTCSRDLKICQGCMEASDKIRQMIADLADGNLTKGYLKVQEEQSDRLLVGSADVRPQNVCATCAHRGPENTVMWTGRCKKCLKLDSSVDEEHKEAEFASQYQVVHQWSTIEHANLQIEVYSRLQREFDDETRRGNSKRTSANLQKSLDRNQGINSRLLKEILKATKGIIKDKPIEGDGLGFIQYSLLRAVEVWTQYRRSILSTGAYNHMYVEKTFGPSGMYPVASAKLDSAADQKPKPRASSSRAAAAPSSEPAAESPREELAASGLTNATWAWWGEHQKYAAGDMDSTMFRQLKFKERHELDAMPGAGAAIEASHRR